MFWQTSAPTKEGPMLLLEKSGLEKLRSLINN